MQRDHEVGPRPVREVGPGGLVGAGVVGREPPSAQVRRDPERPEAALDARREVGGDRRLGQATAAVAGVGPAVARVDDDDLADQRGAAAPDRLRLAQRVRRPAGDRALQLAERLERLGAAGAVVDQADVALEVAHGAVGLAAEDAVDAAGVETHVEQPLLQGGDVVTDRGVPDGVLEDAVTEGPARLVEQPPGLRADDAVDAGPALLLEVAYGAVEGVVEGVGRDRPGAGAARGASGDP